MIKEILNNLSNEERTQLMYAFENDFAQYILLPDNRFIGVNVNINSQLTVTENRGSWSYGRIKESA
jgi:hypothetical protein